MTKLLIVESVTKAREIQPELGRDWRVLASFGHIRQLAKDGENALGINIGETSISCRFALIESKKNIKKLIRELKDAVAAADEVYLGTDKDREGETIAWHLQQVLRLRQVRRVEFTEITASGIRRAIASPRPLDLDVVNAGLARSCLDKIVGYCASPLLWSLRSDAKSCGRVQSWVLHLICQREREIKSFVPEDYWRVFVEYAEGFRAVALREESDRISTAQEADRLVQLAQSHPHQVVELEGKNTSKKAPPPFITSTLLTAAGKVGLEPEDTMKIAQRLFEGGYITYMRTDSTNLSEEFTNAVRNFLGRTDPDNLPNQVQKHRAKKGAQEAHEAIRPTDITKLPDEQPLEEDAALLYRLIWLRAIASQCRAATLCKTNVITQSGTARWQAKGQVLQFEGYSRYWSDIGSDSELPALQKGQIVHCDRAESEKKQTTPPPRFGETEVVAELEKRKIGRPATYATFAPILKKRNYAHTQKRKFVPTELGLAVDEFLSQYLPDLIETSFTAQMEESLDQIANGDLDWQSYLTSWYWQEFSPAVARAQKTLPSRPSRQREQSDVDCPCCGNFLSKIPSKSKKIAVPYFLRCEHGCEDVVLFFDKKRSQWVQPGQNPPQILSDFKCPECGKPLEEYEYTKKGQTKVLLRCSDSRQNWKNKKWSKQHQDVVYYRSRDRWWSPKYGELS